MRLHWIVLRLTRRLSAHFVELNRARRRNTRIALDAMQTYLRKSNATDWNRKLVAMPGDRLRITGSGIHITGSNYVTRNTAMAEAFNRQGGLDSRAMGRIHVLGNRSQRRFYA